MRGALAGRMMVLLFAALLGSGAAPAHAAAELTLAAAINQAGRQRMLSQRQAVAWLMIGLGTAPQRGQLMLQESMARFDTQLAALKTLAPFRVILQYDTQLGREIIGRQAQAGDIADQVFGSPQCRAAGRAAIVLPGDERGERLPAGPVPDQERRALAAQAERRGAVCLRKAGAEHLIGGFRIGQCIAFVVSAVDGKGRGGQCNDVAECTGIIQQSRLDRRRAEVKCDRRNHGCAHRR